MAVGEQRGLDRRVQMEAHRITRSRLCCALARRRRRTGTGPRLRAALPSAASVIVRWCTMPQAVGIAVMSRPQHDAIGAGPRAPPERWRGPPTIGVPPMQPAERPPIRGSRHDDVVERHRRNAPRLRARPGARSSRAVGRQAAVHHDDAAAGRREFERQAAGMRFQADISIGGAPPVSMITHRRRRPRGADKPNAARWTSGAPRRIVVGKNGRSARRAASVPCR